MANVPLNLLRSYLRATGIAHTRSSIPGIDLAVSRKDGGTIEVRVVSQEDTTAPCECVDVQGFHLTGKSKQKALEAFWRVSRAAGRGQPIPFDRGEEPEHKLSYADEEFLVAIRATETRRAPNPPVEKFSEYEKVMAKAVNIFYNVNGDMCRRWGMERDDVMQHARTLFVNFCARFEDDLETQANNERTLYVYLRQRLAEVYAVLRKKQRSVFPDADTVCIASTGVAYQPGGMFTEALVGIFDPRAEPEKTDVEYRSRNRKLDCSSPTKRKESAGRALVQGLESMGHDEMVDKLSFMNQNILIPYDARRLAGKLLAVHVASCSDCGGTKGASSAPAIEEDEELVLDEGCAQE